MCLRPLAIGLVFLIAMGRRKFKIGRAHKNYEKRDSWLAKILLEGLPREDDRYTTYGSESKLL